MFLFNSGLLKIAIIDNIDEFYIDLRAWKNVIVNDVSELRECDRCTPRKKIAYQTISCGTPEPNYVLRLQ
jgi:hypothetical protein